MKTFKTSEAVEACPGCGHRDFGVSYPPDVCRCGRCSLLFRHPRPTQAEIASVYDQGVTYDGWHKQDAYFNTLWQRRAKLVKVLRPNGRLLDVGVGDGGFLAAAKAAGFDVEGTELSQTGASFAKEKGLTVRMGQFTDLSWPAASFDIITIWHVLEHVPNPGAVIQHAYRLLKPGGLLVIAVPNETHAILRHKLFPRGQATPFETLRPGNEIHLTHFEPRTLIALLEREKFAVQELQVDDFYPDRSPVKRLKVACYQLLAKLTRWHCAACMQVIARKPAGGVNP